MLDVDAGLLEGMKQATTSDVRFWPDSAPAGQVDSGALLASVLAKARFAGHVVKAIDCLIKIHHFDIFR